MALNASEWRARLRDELVVLDGGFATALEAGGYDIANSLWSAGILLSDPDAVRAVHNDYARAGADVISTASYQVTRAGFAAAGLEPETADHALRAAVDLARVSTDVAVAASLGPFGASRADGSEYRGDYGVPLDELKHFHRERLHALQDSGADLLAFETVPSALEVQAICELLEDEFPETPAWLSVSCKDDNSISDGTPIAAVMASISASALVAFGINCTKPEHISPLLSRLESTLPFVVYPNAGRTWDPQTKEWLDDGVADLPDSAILQWRAQGAGLIGGCCGLGPEYVAHVRAVAQTNNKP